MVERCRIVQRIALLMLLFSPVFAEAQTVRITGTVRDAQLGEPLVGAPVYLLGTTSVAITGADGQFAINGVKVGQYLLMALHKGYAPQTDTVVVSGDTDSANDFNLFPITGGSEHAIAKHAIAKPAIGPEDKPSDASTEIQRSRKSELKTVCACFESAITILGDAISLRKEFESLEEYQKDTAAVSQMNTLMDKWRQAQQHCLTKFGTQLFSASACNRPDEVSEKRSELSDLGIRT